jgi:hypothetical protein
VSLAPVMPINAVVITWQLGPRIGMFRGNNTPSVKTDSAKLMFDAIATLFD